MQSINLAAWVDAPPQRVWELLSSAESIGAWRDAQTRKETPQGVVLEHTAGPEHGTVRFLVLANEHPCEVALHKRASIECSCFRVV